MELYNNNDVLIFNEKVPLIVKKLQEQEQELFGTPKEHVDKAHEILIKYVKENKRKVYGGYALNLLVKNKNSADAPYKEGEHHDMDIYSPEPINDLIKVCNLMADAGIKYVQGTEADHKETYTIKINNIPYCDFSYVARLIYNKIPFSQIDGFYVSAPEFITIDYYRAFTDPTTSSFKWDKMFARFQMLQKYYPVKLPKTIPKIPFPKLDPKIEKYFEQILSEKKTLIAFGAKAYNTYVKFSGINDIPILSMSYYEMFSTNYEKDVPEIVNDLRELLKDTKMEKVTRIEYYPFFQFYDFNVDVLYDNVLIAKIYGHNRKCIPFVSVDKIKIGTFHVNMMMEYIKAIYAHVNEDTNIKNSCYVRINNMLKMRKFYFDKTNKNFLSDTIFKDFVTDCCGKTISSRLEKQLRIEKNKKKGRPLVFKYDPYGKRKDESTYQFANTSGTLVIKKEKDVSKDTDMTKDKELSENKGGDEYDNAPDLIKDAVIYKFVNSSGGKINKTKNFKFKKI